MDDEAQKEDHIDRKQSKHHHIPLQKSLPAAEDMSIEVVSSSPADPLNYFKQSRQIGEAVAKYDDEDSYESSSANADRYIDIMINSRPFAEEGAQQNAQTRKEVSLKADGAEKSANGITGKES